MKLVRLWNISLADMGHFTLFGCNWQYENDTIGCECSAGLFWTVTSCGENASQWVRENGYAMKQICILRLMFRRFFWLMYLPYLRFQSDWIAYRWGRMTAMRLFCSVPAAPIDKHGGETDRTLSALWYMIQDPLPLRIHVCPHRFWIFLIRIPLMPSFLTMKNRKKRMLCKTHWFTIGSICDLPAGQESQTILAADLISRASLAPPFHPCRPIPERKGRTRQRVSPEDNRKLSFVLCLQNDRFRNFRAVSFFIAQCPGKNNGHSF